VKGIPLENDEGAETGRLAFGLRFIGVLLAFCWRLTAFYWRLAVFDWRLDVFDWRLDAFDLRLACIARASAPVHASQPINARPAIAFTGVRRGLTVETRGRCAKKEQRPHPCEHG
jgi:hypothetical protein